MALNGKFISFQPIIESVYRRAGYQQIDWGEAMEVIGETIRLIGALPAYKNITTNGIDGTNPLEVADYRVALPSDLVNIEGIRKVGIHNYDGTLKIIGIYPMYENTDLHYKTNNTQLIEGMPVGTYNYEEFKQTNTITLSGTSGTATVGGPLTKTVTFTTSLETSATNFVTANAVAYLAEGIVLTSSGDALIFVASQSGVPYTDVTITNATGDLTGSVVSGTATDPIQVYGQNYVNSYNYQYQYKIDNDYIYTNFEEGYIELAYKAFVTDSNGFPMIPDDQRYIEAIRWAIIEHLDYKKWRVAEISDKVYYHSVQERDFYIASARSKAAVPTNQMMETLKNMFLRTIVKTDDYNASFKYSGMRENRYTGNNRYRSY